MPNWCYNEATLIAERKSQIDELVTALEKIDAQQGDEFFNILRPRPADQAENWYEWNCENWGTKWDASIQSWSRVDDTQLNLTFETAWSPPTELYNYLFDQGWDITAKYHEPGMGFIGEYDNTIDDCFEYEMTEESISEVPQELVEWANLWEDYNFYQEMNEQESHSGDGQEDE